MKILSASQIREADAATIKNEPISSILLMERAARTFVDCMQELGFLNERFCFEVYCGPGNNGGDGLAIARLLSGQGFAVNVFLLPSSKHSDDYTENLHKLEALKNENLNLFSSLPAMEVVSKKTEEKIILDALFGTGLNKPADGIAAEWIRHINGRKGLVLAVDIPSGMFADSPVENVNDPAVIRAAHTLTFQQPKLSFFFADQAPYVGFFHVLDIGLDKKFMDSLASPYAYVNTDFASNLLSPRAKFSHKGDYGHALIVAGSYGKMGAAVLAVQACLRSGAGLVSVHIPACGYEIMQTAAPEAMVYADEEKNTITSSIHLDPFNAVGVGPGIGMDKQTGNILKLLIQQSANPLVLDADALNLLGENKTWISFIPKGSILTPHPREFERLTGMKGSSFDRFVWQKEFSIKHGVYVVLKGANTSVSCPGGEVFFNATGNPGMAKGGSGDVLTGIITGLLAQGYVPQEAAVLGVYLHGLAGDIVAEHLSMEGMTAGDIAGALGEAFVQLRN